MLKPHSKCLNSREKHRICLQYYDFLYLLASLPIRNLELGSTVPLTYGWRGMHHALAMATFQRSGTAKPATWFKVYGGFNALPARKLCHFKNLVRISGLGNFWHYIYYFLQIAFIKVSFDWDPLVNSNLVSKLFMILLFFCVFLRYLLQI